MKVTGNELLGIFNRLGLDSIDAGSILAIQLDAAPTVRIGRNEKGEPCVLFVTAKAGSSRHVTLKHLEVQQGVHFRVAAPNGQRERLAGTMIVCHADAALVRLFFGFVADALSELGSAPSDGQLAQWIAAATRLFSRLEKTGTKELRGLWAELLFISSLPDPEVGVRRWHDGPNEQFDFLAVPFAVEVKSCSDLQRIHHFSLGQLTPPTEMQVWIASIVVRADTEGTSVLELLNSIEGRIADARARADLRSMVLTCAGRGIDEERHHRFDEAGARKTLQLFDVQDIPTLECKIPPEVIKVSLQVRCSEVRPVCDDLGEVQRHLS